jgi:hypothetical protein
METFLLRSSRWAVTKSFGGSAAMAMSSKPELPSSHTANLTDVRFAGKETEIPGGQ